MSTNAIIPYLWFDGQAKEAAEFYVSVFKEGKIRNMSYYPDSGPQAGQVLSVEFEIMGMDFVAINAEKSHSFTESISFLIPCKDQDEIDHYWNSLTAEGGKESRCGWLEDKFGLSWQVCPKNMKELMSRPGAFQKLMGMRKIIMAAF